MIAAVGSQINKPQKIAAPGVRLGIAKLFQMRRQVPNKVDPVAQLAPRPVNRSIELKTSGFDPRTLQSDEFAHDLVWCDARRFQRGVQRLDVPI